MSRSLTVWETHTVPRHFVERFAGMGFTTPEV
jgi:hypothetical protein